MSEVKTDEKEVYFDTSSQRWFVREWNGPCQGFSSERDAGAALKLARDWSIRDCESLADKVRDVLP